MLETQYKQAFSTMQEQKALITQLEEDLRSVNAVSSMFRGDAEVCLNTVHYHYLGLSSDPSFSTFPTFLPSPSFP